MDEKLNILILKSTDLLDVTQDDIINLICLRINELINARQDIVKFNKIKKLFIEEIDLINKKYLRIKPQLNEQFKNIFNYEYSNNIKELKNLFKNEINDNVDKYKSETLNETINEYDESLKDLRFQEKVGNRVINKPLKQTTKEIINTIETNKTQSVETIHNILQSKEEGIFKGGIRVYNKEINKAYNLKENIEYNLQSKTNNMTHKMFEDIGKMYGADGWEVSVHLSCAPDHLDFQGKQFSNQEYKNIQEELKRPLMTYNCRHHVFPVILGINKPTYTLKQLEEIKNKNLKEIKFNNKKYNYYELNQLLKTYTTQKEKIKQALKYSKNSGSQTLETKFNNQIKRLNQKIKALKKEINDFK